MTVRQFCIPYYVLSEYFSLKIALCDATHCRNKYWRHYSCVDGSVFLDFVEDIFQIKIKI